MYLSFEDFLSCLITSLKDAKINLHGFLKVVHSFHTHTQTQLQAPDRQTHTHTNKQTDKTDTHKINKQTHKYLYKLDKQTNTT